MTNQIVVAGPTGNLGRRIVKALLKRNATVIALVRIGTSEDKVNELNALGARVEAVDMTIADQIARAIDGADCMVSALAGLRDVIVDTQKMFVSASIKAGVPKFIPSDFSTDFTKLAPGENRNFDLRREFHEFLDVAPITSTAIFNGAFAEILNYSIPIYDFKRRKVGYWEDPNHKMDFTTMDDAAAYTASAALDRASPHALRIASFRVSPNELVRFTAATLNTPFELVKLGTLEELRLQNKRARAADPDGEKELYPQWQQGQYMQSMFSTQHESYDNDRYPELKWTKLEEFLQRDS